MYAAAIALLGCAPSHGSEGAMTTDKVPSAPTITLGETPTTTSAAVGELIEVRLVAQQAAGYGWDIAPPLPEGIKLVDSGLAPPGASIDGRPETQLFHFRATAPGRYTLRFDYRRPWEKSKPPERSVTHVIEATSAR